MWLASGDPSHGFELVGLLLPDGETFLRFERFEQTVGPREQLAAIVQSGGPAAGAPKGLALPACLLAGHENFAHFMWNELPALIEAEAAVSPRVQICAVWDTIAPLERLVRWRAAKAVKHVNERPLLAAPGYLHPAILFAAGATRMSLATKARLIQACGTAPERLPRRFVVWISLRLTHRHPVNQLEVCILLLRQLAALPFPVEVILDGYSLAADLQLLDRHHIKRERARAEAVVAHAAELRSAVAHEIAAKVIVTDATRASLPVSIALAGRADFYFCHHGTQQHKIGWVYPTPGVIHAPPSVVRRQPAHWTQHQSEGSVLPDYVPEPLVAELSEADERANPGSLNYRFADPAAVVAYVLNRLLPVAATKGFTRFN
jgi:hypothetical protein